MIVVPEESQRQWGAPLRSVSCQEDLGRRGWSIDTEMFRVVRPGLPSSG